MVAKGKEKNGQKIQKIKILRNAVYAKFEKLINEFLATHEILSVQIFPRGAEADKGFYGVITYTCSELPTPEGTQEELNAVDDMKASIDAKKKELEAQLAALGK